MAFDFTQEDITSFGRHFVGTSVLRGRLVNSLEAQTALVDTQEDEESMEAAQQKQAAEIAAATAKYSGTEGDAIVLD